LVNRRLTKQHFHVYLNPERTIDAGAIEVHGITNEFLADKPLFKDVVEDFLQFIRGAEVIIHNAPFDVGFLNHELKLLEGALGVVEDYCSIVDSLAFARKKHPGQRNSLDALCKRYGIDNSHRELHGALLDAEILADVYLLMTGGQGSLLDDDSASETDASSKIQRLPADRPKLKIITCSAEEQQQHEQRLQAIQKASGACVWLAED
jgi:DNA polymerase III subunit epsilon